MVCFLAMEILQMIELYRTYRGVRRCEHWSDLCSLPDMNKTYNLFVGLTFALLVTPLVDVIAQVPYNVHAPDAALRNEVRVVNGSYWPITVSVVPKDSTLALQGMQFVLHSRDTIMIADYTTLGEFRSPVETMTVKGTMTNTKGKVKTIGVLMMEKRQISKEHRVWYYEVMPASGGSMRFGF